MGRMASAALDECIANAMNQSYHTGDAGWETTAVRWWMRYHFQRGEDPFKVASSNASDQEKLEDEWRMMRFQTWLVEGKEPGVAVETAAQYGSTVQGFLGRVLGVKLGGGMQWNRLPQMLKGLHRLKGGKPQRKLRRALTPQLLAMAFLRLDPEDPVHANVRAALATMLQGLLRGGEAGVSDKDAANWSAARNVTRADISFGEDYMQLVMTPLKNEHYLGAKACPVIIGRPQPGELPLIDATWEVLNLFRVDPAFGEEAARTPLFRNPKTGKALRVSELNQWVQWLMESIGENPMEFGSHSARIGGATALYARGVSELDIRTMGRWDTDVYRIYIRGDRTRAARVTCSIGRQEVSPTLDPYDEVDFF